MNNPLGSYQTNREQGLGNRILDSQLFKRYHSAFTVSTGLPLDFIPVDNLEKFPFADHANESHFCQMLRSACPKGWAMANACLLSEAQRRGDTFTSETFGGLFETAIPVHLGKELIGFLRVGQALAIEPSEESFLALVERLRAKGLRKNAEGILRKAYAAIPIVPLNQYTGIIDLLQVFAEQLSEQANRTMLMQRQHEPALIAQAKNYILEHLDERITLQDVAFHVSVTTFYFCKVFRKHAGMTFTAFVSRLRVEKAKRLLGNRYMSVTEIAYEVGFQSLSQFNRCFKRYVGKSPTEYRKGGREAMGTTTETLFTSGSVTAGLSAAVSEQRRLAAAEPVHDSYGDQDCSAASQHGNLRVQRGTGVVLVEQSTREAEVTQTSAA